MIIKIMSFTILTLFLVSCDQKDNTVTAPPPPTKVSVKVAKVERSDVQTWIFGEGTARAVKREFMSFENAGRIAFIDPQLKEGDSVTQGQLLAYQEKNISITGNKNESNISQLSHTALRDAKVNLDFAFKNYQRFKELHKKSFASQQDLDEVKAKYDQAQVSFDNAKIIADESRIISPIDGVIARLNIKQGTYFSPSQINKSNETNELKTIPILVIDPSSFELTIDLPSFYFSQIEEGSKTIFKKTTVSMQAPTSKSDRSIVGVVYSISPSVNPDTRTFTVTLRSTSGAEYLQDGEYLSVWIAGAVAYKALSIPINSFRFENNQPYVFVVNAENHTVSKTFVTLGLSSTSAYELKEGLSIGDQLVTEGRSRLSDGDMIKILPANDEAK